MSRKALIVSVLSVFLIPVVAFAQNTCASTGTQAKLICLVPQLYGPNGFQVLKGSGPAQLVNSFGNLNVIPSLNSAIAGQAVLLPLASPSSGITYSWDPISKTFSPSTDSFGPIYGERAETIGKGRVFLGASYQFLRFSRLDGTDLKSLPQVFTQPDTDLGFDNRTCSIDGDNTTDCAFIRDVVTVSNRIDFKVQQVVAFLTYGLTDRIDLSAAIPIETVKMSLFSLATIVNNSNSEIHAFDTRPDCGSVAKNGNCLDQPFSASGSASGIGDITVRAKATAWKGERAALALGADVRIPTGDSLNFLGSGTVGVQPFVVWSYRSRVSPHLGAGFQFNGKSRVLGDLAAGSSARLPNEFVYSAGADFWINKRFTVAADLVGQTTFQSERLLATKFTEPGACTVDYPTCTDPGTVATPAVAPAVAQATGNINVLNVSVGFKAKLVSNLLFIGNAVFKVNDAGLRSKVVPMAEISYTF